MGKSSDGTQAIAVRVADVEGQLNRRIATQQRELGDLRQFIEALTNERERAVQKANAIELERIQAVRIQVESLFAEKQKALDAALTAQKEAVSKAELATDRIAARAAGDQDALRGEMTERLAALRRELESATAAQKEAVIKQEQANERRFETTNEWRAQSADRERSSTEERVKLQATFMLKEVADNQFSQIRTTSDSRYEVLNKQLAQLTSRMDTMGGQDEGTAQATRARDTARTFIIGVVLAFAAVMTLIALVATATHGFTK